MSGGRATLHEVVRLLSARGLGAARVPSETWRGPAPLLRSDGSDAPEKRLAAWRGDSPLLLPATRGSGTGMSAGCYCWLLAQPADLPDRTVVRGLEVAAMARTEPEAVRWLSEVVAWATSGVRPSVSVANRLRRRDCLLKPEQRLGPDDATIKAWNLQDRSDAFSHWLTARKEREWGRQALRLVESALREIGLIPEADAVDNWVAQQASPPRARAAWKLYVEYCREGAEPHPEPATPGRPGRPSGTLLPPAEVCAAVALLVATVGATRVTQLRWTDVASQDDAALTLNTRSEGNAVAVIEGEDAQCIEALRRWGSCGDDGPIVPKRPGSMAAASARTVKRWAADARLGAPPE